MRSARAIDALHALLPLADDCSDGELLARYASSRNGAAFAELVRRHGPMVYGACRRIANNGADADDAFQATFFVLARRASSIRSTSAVGCWLHAVAVKVSRKARQQAIKRRVRQMAAARPEAVQPDTPMADWWAVVDEELQQLPEVLRQAILTCDIGDKSRSQAARELGWPEGTVAKRLARARQELAKRLARRGVTLGVAALSAALAAEARSAVPGQVLAETIRQALAYAVAPGSGSVVVRTLAEGVMRSMKISVVRSWALTALAALLLAGAGIVVAVAATQPPQDQTDPPKVAGKNRGAKPDSLAWKERPVLETPGWLPGSLAYAPDGKALVVGGTGGKVIAYATANFKEKWTADMDGPFAAVAFSADGKSVLATFKNGVRFLDADTGQAGMTIEADALTEGQYVAVGAFPDRVIESGNEKLISHKIVLGTPNGYVVKEWIDSAAPGTITVSTVAKDRKPADAMAVPLAVDPNGTSAIITGPVHRDTGRNVLWAYVCGGHGKDSPGNRLLEGHEAVVVSAAWSRDGKTAVTGDAGGRVIVWDAQAMRESRRLEFGQRIAALAVAADGKQIAAVVVGKQAEFYVWETARPSNNRKPIHVDAFDFAGPIRASLAFSPDGRQLAGTVYNAEWLARLGELIGKVHVWETPNPDARGKPPAPPQPGELAWKLAPPITDPQFDIRSVALSSDGKKFAIESGGKTIAYETATSKKLLTFDGIAPRFIGGDLYMLSHCLARYDAETGKEKQTFATLTKLRLVRAAISPNGKAVAGNDGATVILCDAATGLLPVPLAGQGRQAPKRVDTFPTDDIAWSHDGRHVAGVYPCGEKSDQGGFAVWDAATGKQLVHLEKTPANPCGRTMSFAFSPNDRLIGIAGLTRDARGASSLTLLDATTLKPLHETRIDSRDGGADVTAIAFSPDGSTLAAAVHLHSGKSPLVRVVLWNPASPELVHLLPEHDTPPITSLAFAPDGQTLVAATGTLSTFEVPQSKETLHRILIWRGEPRKR
jgi:RNA polymerase sigma factor (sigma-70 family)